ncbi:unnamed protein product [Cuscuta europaea]|uniref:Uncharacterized protein n=1 Tax=Cuscuta europaea TaxID=41803 RepID=A0A9P1E839_CUSEU|nr:unnamed protein product [Cuscuta europaea]
MHRMAAAAAIGRTHHNQRREGSRNPVVASSSASVHMLNSYPEISVGSRNHWQLFILSPIQNTIVFLCSLGNKPNRQFKNIIDAAMEASCRLNSRKGRVKWIIPMRFANPEPFSSEEIDEVRTRWASYFLEMTQSINDT